MAELGCCPLSGRRERQVAGDLPPLGCGVMGDDRLERGVGRRVRCAERPEHLRSVSVGRVADRLDRRQADLAGGDRAGLVEAQGVDPGEQLDRGQLLGQRLATGEGDHPGDEAEAREQHQAVGHHGDRCGNGGLERISPHDRVVAELAEQQQHRRRRNDEREPAQDDVDPAPQLAVGQLEPASLLGELGGVGVGADVDRAVEARAGRHERARQHLVVLVLLDGVALAGEQRLVELEARRGEHIAVDHDLVTRAEFKDVIGHDLADTDLDGVAVAPDPGFWRRQHRKFVERAAGLEFLDDADHRVGDDDTGEERVGRVASNQDQDEEGADDAVDRGENVGPDDLTQRADRCVGDIVDPTIGDSFCDLGGGEAGDGRGHAGTPSSS